MLILLMPCITLRLKLALTPASFVSLRSMYEINFLIIIYLYFSLWVCVCKDKGFFVPFFLFV